MCRSLHLEFVSCERGGFASKLICRFSIYQLYGLLNGICQFCVLEIV